ncbi:MAG: TetR/AcrR family transcriptional regulator [Thermosulfidibacteraceae bacterium]|jgi:TetR/AcrR family fatty acid metabolism transcriptional regulator
MPKTKTYKKRDLIIDAAEKVFASKGYHNARILDVAREAGVAEGTIYLYFESKEDLLLAIFKDRMSKWVGDLKERLKGSSLDPLMKLRLIIESHFKTLYENPHWAQLVQIELRACSVFMRGGSAPELREYIRVIEEVLEEGKEKNIFSGDLNIWVSARMLLGIMDEFSTIWVLKRKLELPSLVDVVLEIYTKGILKRRCDDEF